MDILFTVFLAGFFLCKAKLHSSAESLKSMMTKNILNSFQDVVLLRCFRCEV